MDTFLTGWPYLGLAAAAAQLLWLLLSPRFPKGGARLADPAWLACLGLPLYMAHQFEEHGIDALGRHYSFLEAMCTTLGYGGDLAHCPADAWFILAVNVGGVWIGGLLATVFASRRPLVGGCFFGIPLVNGVAHLLPALAKGTYNPGVVTSVVLFAPVMGLALRGFFAAGVLDARRFPAVVGTGVGVHAVLMGSLQAFAHGVIPKAVLLLLQVACGFLPLAAATLVGRKQSAPVDLAR